MIQPVDLQDFLLTFFVSAGITLSADDPEPNQPRDRIRPA